jgi:hypothetical protein
MYTVIDDFRCVAEIVSDVNEVLTNKWNNGFSYVYSILATLNESVC